MTRILVVEDEAVIRRELRRKLEGQGYEVVDAGTVGEAQAAIAASRFDLVLADVRLPGGAGTDLLGQTGGAPVVIMTAYATVETAVDAMKLGAVDYVQKPFKYEDLLCLLDRVVRTHRTVADRTGVDALVGESLAMREVRERILRAAPSDLKVLIVGETGTGKELVAKAIHRVCGRRAGPFVPVNCAAIPESLIESEFFGVAKGAATGADLARAGLFESANGGTLFLDEIGELSPAAQAKLLRVLQDREVRRLGTTHTVSVDFRLVSATHRDLPTMVDQGTFRSDLYYRVCELELPLPPLRERGDDLFVLAQRLLDRAPARAGKPGVALSEAARRAMAEYWWPGNVRELENVLKSALVFCDGDTIEATRLRLDRTSAARRSSTPPSAVSLDKAPSLEEYFDQFVLAHQGKLSEKELARRLGISRKTLWKRRKRRNLPRSR